jgi:hypothetical protein
MTKYEKSSKFVITSASILKHPNISCFYPNLTKDTTCTWSMLNKIKFMRSSKRTMLPIFFLLFNVTRRVVTRPLVTWKVMSLEHLSQEKLCHWNTCHRHTCTWRVMSLEHLLHEKLSLEQLSDEKLSPGHLSDTLVIWRVMSLEHLSHTELCHPDTCCMNSYITRRFVTFLNLAKEMCGSKNAEKLATLMSSTLYHMTQPQFARKQMTAAAKLLFWLVFIQA